MNSDSATKNQKPLSATCDDGPDWVRFDHALICGHPGTCKIASDTPFYVGRTARACAFVIRFVMPTPMGSMVRLVDGLPMIEGPDRTPTPRAMAEGYTTEDCGLMIKLFERALVARSGGTLEVCTDADRLHDLFASAPFRMIEVDPTDPDDAALIASLGIELPGQSSTTAKSKLPN